ncbi:DUF397 domain-containing protein [Streptomyces avicenniae]|uniref:DUF397 domain-containing protein n=1 Tax=Streptomyces avicenniae TaxID=500153 RepID=UPI0006994277|nr:DUF397 domain-containing protein [Streptomyces avicenniae]
MRGTSGDGRAGWRRSSYSNADGGNCVEVAEPRCVGCLADVPVRDSKRPYGPALAFAPATWCAFVLHVGRRHGRQVSRMH